MIDPKSLTLRRLPEEERMVSYGRRKRTERKLRHYRVETSDGVVLGRVYEAMATFETRAEGRRYVSTRWTSPRWYFDIEGRYRAGGRSFSESRKAALEFMIEVLEQPHEQ